jgi:hypothetical protein
VISFATFYIHRKDFKINKKQENEKKERFDVGNNARRSGRADRVRRRHAKARDDIV